MRQIKFRGYNEAQGWVYGNLLMSEVDIQGNCVCEIHTPFADSMSVSRCFVDPKSVGQFVGLRDKNGKEIYEGDIIRTPAGHIVSISFGERIYRVKLNGRNDEIQCYGWIATKISNGHIETLDDSMTAGEVIGNIYESPELLNP